MTQDTTPTDGTRRGRRARARAPQRVARMVGAGLLALPLGTLGSIGDVTLASATPVPAITAQPAPSQPTDAEAQAAFWEADYTLSDAEQLATLWQLDSVGDAKTRAGQKILQGLPLPSPADLAADEARAFYNAGYSYWDSVVLAWLWDSPSPQAAKVAAGAKLLDRVPVPPSDDLTADVYAEAQAAFLAAGYTPEDGIYLAELWNLDSPGDAKAAVGAKLLEGIPVPPPDDLDADPYLEGVRAFLDAGYTYADAQELAGLWDMDNPVDTKARAGQKLLDGLPLPIDA